MLENTPQTNSLYVKIEELLKSIPELVTEEKELRYNKIKEMAESGDAILLIPLMQNAEIKNAFFTPILDSFVFKTKEFKEFLDYSSSNNSYSQYLGKKIGLYCGDSALTDRNEVVLNFPFKDCVLEGGQKKEDGLDTYFEYDEKTGEYVKKQSKRREVFFNETLAKDEIDNLFSPKAFCNVKKFSTDGEASCVDFTRDAEINKNRGLSEDTITDNLIIKGNNLLALHSLKKEFEGKIKLIYIDPPYNTGSDGFSYNDNFNHSSWLTFMKNRLEVAKDLLRDDGCIFVSVNNVELAYIIFLLDEIFKRDNRLPLVTLKAGTTASYRAINECPVNVTEYVVGYTKKSDYLLNRQYKATSYTEDYSHVITNFNEEPNKWIIKPIIDVILEKDGCKNLQEMKERYKFNYKKIKFDKLSEYAFNNKERIVSLNTMQKPSEKVKLIIELSKKQRGKVFEIKRENKTSIFCYNGRSLAFYINKFREVDGVFQPTEILTNLWNDISFLGIGPEGNVTLMNGKKPEKLLERIILLSTNPSDIILDYHLGSGTTAAVAHKMNRQYIGVEQLNYGENDSVVRLQNVINGDSTGISKSVNWQGGGSFVYMELAEKNEKAMQLISACKNYDELVSIFNTLSTKYFLHYNVRINDFINKTCKEEQFKNLSLEKQKEIFCRMLDLNQLYVNCDDRNDKDSGLSEKDIKATENFYQIQKDGE